MWAVKAWITGLYSYVTQLCHHIEPIFHVIKGIDRDSPDHALQRLVGTHFTYFGPYKLGGLCQVARAVAEGHELGQKQPPGTSNRDNFALVRAMLRVPRARTKLPKHTAILSPANS